MKMAKYLKKKRSRWVFPLCAAIYALIFLGVTAYGLRYLWNYADAYEKARPHHAIDAYMEQLTPDYIADRCTDLIATIDHHIQSEEACRAAIAEAVSEGITYAKKTSACTDEKMVYVLRTGNRVIGSFDLEVTADAVMGHAPWAVAGDSFDFSYLLTDTVSATVPEEFPVYVNGALLNDTYITESGIRYTQLEDYYETYQLPHIVSYSAGPCLGSIDIQITDPHGEPIVIDENTDMNQFLNNCTEAETQELNDFIENFVTRYVKFSSSNNNNRYTNYNQLSSCVLKGSDLATRLRQALSGLQYGQSRSDKIVSITANQLIRLDETTYLCDITYVVDTTGRDGVIQNTFSTKLIVVQTDSGLRAQSLLNY